MDSNKSETNNVITGKFSDVVKDNSKFYRLESGVNELTVIENNVESFPQHWINGKWYNCVGKELNCPYCPTGDIPHSRFRTKVKDVDGNVKSLEGSKRLFRSLTRFLEKENMYGNPIIIERAGSDMDTKYTIKKK